jgi:preprotein translocase subunit SecE
MAQIFRRQPASSQTTERPKSRTAPQQSSNRASNAIGRLRTNIDDIIAELRKVTWPNREETRNLTIVVIGISAGLGLLLGGIDLILSQIYQLIAG